MNSYMFLIYKAFLQPIQRRTLLTTAHCSLPHAPLGTSSIAHHFPHTLSQPQPEEPPLLDFPHLCKIRSAFVHWLMTVVVGSKKSQQTFACVHIRVSMYGRSHHRSVAYIRNWVGGKGGAPTAYSQGQKAPHLRSSGFGTCSGTRYSHSHIAP